MGRFRFIILIVIIGAAVAMCGSNVGDWQQARWGMTVSEVQSSFPGRTETPIDNKYAAKYNGYLQTDEDSLIFMRFELSGKPSIAFFHFDAKRLLHRIEVLPIDYVQQSFVDSILAGLNQKYGTPYSS